MLESMAPQERLVILLITGEPGRREMLAEEFRAEGFDVILARDVADAHAQARVRPPDLVVIDPSPNGSVARELNRLRADAATGSVPLMVIRRPTTCRAERDVYAWTASSGDVDLLLEHVWRVVNTRVLPRVSGEVALAASSKHRTAALSACSPPANSRASWPCPAVP